MAYTILLLVLTIIQHTRGNYVWTQCVHEVDFSAPRAGEVMQPGMVTQPQMHTPQPMLLQPLPQQFPDQHFAGTPSATPVPSYNTSPERQTPMNMRNLL